MGGILNAQDRSCERTDAEGLGLPGRTRGPSRTERHLVVAHQLAFSVMVPASVRLATRWARVPLAV